MAGVVCQEGARAFRVSERRVVAASRIRMVNSSYPRSANCCRAECRPQSSGQQREDDWRVAGQIGTPAGSGGGGRGAYVLQANYAQQCECFSVCATGGGRVDHDHEIGTVGAEHVAVELEPPDHGVLEDLVLADVRARRPLLPELGEPGALRPKVSNEPL